MMQIFPRPPCAAFKSKSSSTAAGSENSSPVISSYSLSRQIGRGTYATVRLATFKLTKQEFALKVYDKTRLNSTTKRANVRREIRILSKLDHPNIIKFVECIDTTKQVMLVMEYGGTCSLLSYMKRRSYSKLSEAEAAGIFKQLVGAVGHCHDRSISHRDIKLENVLLDTAKKVKIIDFGFSTYSTPEKRLKVFCGTPNYMAPEIVNNQEYCGLFTDVWALGILLYVLLFGTFPFKGVTDRELYRKISIGKFHIPCEASEGVEELLKAILKLNPSARPTCEEILQHTWLAM